MVDRLRELRYDRGHPAQNVRVYTDEEDDLRVGTPSDLVQAFAHKYENLGLAQDAWLDVTAVPRPPLTPKHCAACVRKQVDSIPLEDILPFDTPERNAGEFDDLPFVIGGDFSLGEVRMIYDLKRIAQWSLRIEKRASRWSERMQRCRLLDGLSPACGSKMTPRRSPTRAPKPGGSLDGSHHGAGRAEVRRAAHRPYPPESLPQPGRNVQVHRGACGGAVVR